MTQVNQIAFHIPDYQPKYGNYVTVSVIAFASLMLLVSGILAYNQVDVFSSGIIGRVNAMTMMTTAGGILILGFVILLLTQKCTGTESERTKGRYITKEKIKVKRKVSTKSGSVRGRQRGTSTTTIRNTTDKPTQYYFHNTIDMNIPLIILKKAQADLFANKLNTQSGEHSFDTIFVEDIEPDDDLRSVVAKDKIHTFRAKAQAEEDAAGKARTRSLTTYGSSVDRTIGIKIKAIDNEQHLSSRLNVYQLLALCTEEELGSVGLKSRAKPPGPRRSGGDSLRQPLVPPKERVPASERKDDKTEDHHPTQVTFNVQQPPVQEAPVQEIPVQVPKQETAPEPPLQVPIVARAPEPPAQAPVVVPLAPPPPTDQPVENQQPGDVNRPPAMSVAAPIPDAPPMPSS